MPNLPQIGPPGGLDIPGPAQIPQTNPATAALSENLQRAQENINTVVTGVRRLQVSNQAMAADSAYLSGEHDIELQTFGDPVKMAKYYSMPVDQAQKAFADDVRGQIGALKGKILADNKSIGLELGPQLTIRSGAGIWRLQNRFLAEFDANQRAAFHGPVMDATVNAILQAQPVDAAHLIASQEQRINNVPGLLPNERIEEMDRFHQKLMVGSLENTLNASPTRAIAELQDPGFAQKYPLVTPEQRAQLIARADTALLLPERQANAQFGMLRGNLMDQALQMHANGTFTPAAAQTMYDAGLPESDVKMLSPGFTPSVDDKPETVRSLTTAIREDPLNVTPDDIREEVRSRTLSTATALHLQSELQKSTKFFNTEIHQASVHLRDAMIADVFTPRRATTYTDAGKARVAAETEAFKQNWAAAIKDAKNVHDVYQMWDAFQKQLRPTEPEHPLPELPKAKPGEAPEDYVRRLVSAGYSRDEQQERVSRGMTVVGPTAGPEKPEKPKPKPEGGK